MVRTSLLAAALLALGAGQASAALMMSLDGLPASYIPGTPFTFNVLLQGAEDLSAFNIELRMTASDATAVPDVDFRFDDPRLVFGLPGDPPPGVPLSGPHRYVFADSIAAGDFNWGYAGTATPVGATDILAMGDFLDLGGADTVAGENDVVAAVTVVADRNVGDLVFSIDTDPFALLLVDPFFGNISGYDDLVGVLDSGPLATVSSGADAVIPEPSSLAIFGLMFVCGVALCRRARRGK